MRSTITGLAAAALLVALVAAPAQATVHERFQLREGWSYTEDCGFPVQVSRSESLMVIIREGKNKDAQAFPAHYRFRYSETWTNTETGEWFLIRGHGLFNEPQVTHVEGNIFKFTFVEAGQAFVVEDSDGNVVARNRGALRATYLFDTLGDSEPGGEWIADLDERVAGPHPSLDVHPCEYAVELIG